MSLKPIDLQTSMTQMIEVGKNEHAKAAAIAEQQHIREIEANEKSRLANTKLDEAKKGEKTSIKEKDDSRSGSGHKNAGKENADEKEKPEQELKDDRAGRLIDIRR